MKRIISIFMSLTLCLTLLNVHTEIINNAVYAADAYFQGSGTKDDPFQITSKKDLESLAMVINTPSINQMYFNSYYIQTNDINLQNEQWTPIGLHWDDSYHDGNRTFDGNYNGLGHSVTGLNVTGAYNFAGLFGAGNPTISNLHVEGTVSPQSGSTSFNTVGGLMAEIGYTACISNCSFKGTVSSSSVNNNSGPSACGGLIGNVYQPVNVIVQNSYFNGIVENSKSNSIGGIVGRCILSTDSSLKLSIKNCYSTGKSNRENDELAGSILGGIIDSIGTISVDSCFYTDNMGKSLTSNNDAVSITNSMAISEEELKSEGIINLGLGSAFKMDGNMSNNGYPVGVGQIYHLNGYGTKENPYQISSKEDLFYMSDAVNSEIGYDSYYIQTADIDLENQNFTPIGTYTEYNTGTGFRGNYNGNYHEIDNLFVSRSGEKVNYSGLFGWIYHNGVVSNLVVKGNIEAKTGRTVGGISGDVGEFGRIDNCAFIGSVKSLYTTGGIVGGMWQGAEISNCYFNGTIESLSDDKNLSQSEYLNSCGGIAGLISLANGSDRISTIKNCYAVGKIEQKTSGIKSGAVIGTIYNTPKEQLIIENNYYVNTIAQGAVDSSSFSGCTAFNSNAMKACADMLGSPYVDNNSLALNDGYPVFAWQIDVESFDGLGTAKNPYRINSADDLRKLATYLNNEYYANDFRFACYRQTANIDLKNEKWTPMGGSYEQSFEGVYDAAIHNDYSILWKA